VVAYIENVVKMWLGRVVITEKLEYSNDRSNITILLTLCTLFTSGLTRYL
jgi:hypothetical protein